MLVGLEAPAKHEDSCSRLKIALDIPKEFLPCNWLKRKIEKKDSSNSTSLHMQITRYAVNMVCITHLSSQSSSKDRKTVQIATTTGEIEVNISDIAGFLRLVPRQVTNMMQTAKGVQQLAGEIGNLCRLQKQIPACIQILLTSRIQLAAKLFKENPYLVFNCPHNPGAVEHLRKKVLRKSVKGFPVGLEMTSDKKVYALLKELIGTGNFKKVCLAADLQNYVPRAHATVRIEDGDGKKAKNIQELVDNEFYFQNMLDSPYIVKIFHKCTYPSKDGKITKISLMMEYCNKGDLFEYLVNQNNKQVRDEDLYNILEDCLNALAYLESLNIHHRDIKLENFLVYENENGEIRAKLSDCSFACYIADEKKKSKSCGTIGYCAKEYLLGHEKIKEGKSILEDPDSTDDMKIQGQQLINEGLALSATLKTDIWGMGICLFGMRTGCEFPPVKTQCNNIELPLEIIYESIVNLAQSDVDNAFGCYMDASSLAFLNKRMLTIDAESRPAATECLSIVRNLRAKNAPFV